MTYQESAALMDDFQFRNRVKVAMLGYAQYIHGEAPSTDGHTARYRWAQSAYMNPEQSVMQIHPILVMDDAVQASGAAIDDPTLRSAVERTVNQFI